MTGDRSRRHKLRVYVFGHVPHLLDEGRNGVVYNFIGKGWNLSASVSKG